MLYLEVLIFILGLVMGSFYMVVGSRRPLNESILLPRSHCDLCHHQLSWYELIPVISYLIQGGKCRNCHQKMSIFYPLMELLSGLLFLLSFLIYFPSFSYYNLFVALILSSLLIIIFVSDFKFYVLLDGPLIISITLIFILKLIFFNSQLAFLSLGSGFIVFLIMYLIKVVGDHVFKRESLGGGDVKLSFLIGLTVGLRLSALSILFGSLLALPFAYFAILKNKEREIPYGPFLITGLLITFYFLEPLTTIITTLFI
jgi:leader peptidase (prepilin peptidase)/N-methyltransferase